MESSRCHKTSVFVAWRSVVASCWIGVGLWYSLSLSVYGVSSGTPCGGCVSEGIGGRCCRWLWCVVSSRTCLSSGAGFRFSWLACVSVRALPYV